MLLRFNVQRRRRHVMPKLCLNCHLVGAWYAVCSAWKCGCRFDQESVVCFFILCYIPHCEPQKWHQFYLCTRLTSFLHSHLASVSEDVQKWLLFLPPFLCYIYTFVNIQHLLNTDLSDWVWLMLQDWVFCAATVSVGLTELVGL